MTRTGPDPGDVMTAAEIAAALSVTVQAVTNWVQRWEDFPAGSVTHGQKAYAVSEVITCLDRHRIPGRILSASEKPQATYGQRLRGALELPGMRATDYRPAPPERGMGDRRPPPAPSSFGTQEGDPWAPLMSVLADSYSDEGTVQDIVAALLWLRSSDRLQWDRSANNKHRELRAVLLGHWDKTAASRLASAPSPQDALHSSARLPNIAKALDDALEAWRRGTGTGVSGGLSTTEAFDLLLDRLAQDRRGHLGWYLTPAGVAKTMVKLANAKPGEKILDPCCGYGELLVAAGCHVAANDPGADLSLQGLAQDKRAWRITAINAAVHGLPVQVKPGSEELLSDFSGSVAVADVVVTNPPFATADWTDRDPGERLGWPYGPPPRHSSTFAWLQVAFAALTTSGRAVVVMPPGASDPTHGREREIVRGMVEDGVIRCVVDLPAYLFRETTTPVSLWILGPRAPEPKQGLLLIDGASAVTQQTQTHWVVDSPGLDRIVTAWQGWTDGRGVAESEFAATPTIEEIRNQGYVLTPRRFLRPTPSARLYVAPGTGPDDARSLAGLHRELAQLQDRANNIDSVLKGYLNRLTRRSSR